jgi:hypothetical protein
MKTDLVELGVDRRNQHPFFSQDFPSHLRGETACISDGLLCTFLKICVTDRIKYAWFETSLGIHTWL